MFSYLPKFKKNDASDAYRHYIWAGLMVNEFGKSFSEKVLNAHELEPSQPEKEKAMDLANNRRAVSITVDLPIF